MSTLETLQIEMSRAAKRALRARYQIVELLEDNEHDENELILDLLEASQEQRERELFA